MTRSHDMTRSYDISHVKWPIWYHLKVKNNNFIRNEAKHISIDFKMDDGCALSIVGGSLMTLIAVIFIGLSSILNRDFESNDGCERSAFVSEFGQKNDLISVFGTRSSERKRREIMENVDELRKMKMAIHEKLKNVPLWHSVGTFHLSYLSHEFCMLIFEKLIDNALIWSFLAIDRRRSYQEKAVPRVY